MKKEDIILWMDDCADSVVAAYEDFMEYGPEFILYVLISLAIPVWLVPYLVWRKWHERL